MYQRRVLDIERSKLPMADGTAGNQRRCAGGRDTNIPCSESIWKTPN